jgi:hypothetical protein
MLGSPVVQTVGVILLYSYPALLLIARGTILDPDIWWHLRTGQWVLQHHTVPTTDPFSQYGMGRPWLAYSWLFEVLIALLFAKFNLLGIFIYDAAMRVAVAVALHRLMRRLVPSPRWTLGLTALGVMAMMDKFGPRPGMFTILFFILQYEVLSAARRTGNYRLLFWLPPIYVLWVNLHVQFIYGLFVLSLEALASLLARRLPRLSGSEGEAEISLSRILQVTAACLAATLVNPYTLRIYGVVYDYISQTGAFVLVSELRAPTFRSPYDWSHVAVIVMAFFVLGAHLRRFRLTDVLLLNVATILGLRAVRDAWFTAVVALGVIASGTAATAEPTSRRPRWQPAVVGAGVLVALFTMAAAFGISNPKLERTLAEDFPGGQFPAGAVQYIEEQQLTGPLYNDFDWGGYLIWKLPRLRVYIDGRTNLYGDERLQRHVSVLRGSPNWSSDEDLAAAKLVIGNVKFPLTSLLRMDPRFRVAYEDKRAVVFQSNR